MPLHWEYMTWFNYSPCMKKLKLCKLMRPGKIQLGEVLNYLPHYTVHLLLGIWICWAKKKEVWGCLRAIPSEQFSGNQCSYSTFNLINRVELMTTRYWFLPFIQKHHDLITALWTCMERDRYCVNVRNSIFNNKILI